MVISLFRRRVPEVPQFRLDDASQALSYLAYLSLVCTQIVFSLPRAWLSLHRDDPSPLDLAQALMVI